VFDFSCPVCGGVLIREGASLKCAGAHSFDISKYGYVNLLLSNKSSKKRHGDDKTMARSRSEFLERGWYKPLLDYLCEKLAGFSGDGDRILDAGCGECWYTANIYRFLKESSVNTCFGAVDISKDALSIGARREKDIFCAVAGVYSLPVADGCCRTVLNIFAPCAASEFKRVLCADGMLVRAVPLERHLMGLKEAVYENAYENEPEGLELEGFTISDVTRIEYALTLESANDIDALFKMTPYYYKTSRADQQRLSGLSRLETEIAFCVVSYIKK
jgi:23S rRNA (guanine745-N1)-methyltransferase